MRTLATGVAGCIQSDLAEALAARRGHVIGIDHLSSGKTEHISGLQGHDRFEFIVGDVENTAAVEIVYIGGDRT